MTEPRFEPKDMPLWRRALHAMQTEVYGIHPRLHAYNFASGLLPPRASSELRGRLLRLAGFRVGEHTAIHGHLKITGSPGLVPRLVIGDDCSIGDGLILDLSDSIRIGNRVTIEPGVMLLTSTHELDFPKHRAGKLILNPVTIGDGAWLRARSIVLPGVTVGAGAVIDAGAVVNKDVEANTRVGGTPATKLETLGGP
ncbi:MAG TPA: acyltransferase [Polyangiaceae bacterium]|nr:acyltransferase [Polyangiaceae bacterium]